MFLCKPFFKWFPILANSNARDDNFEESHREPYIFYVKISSHSLFCKRTSPNFKEASRAPHIFLRQNFSRYPVLQTQDPEFFELEARRKLGILRGKFSLGSQFWRTQRRRPPKNVAPCYLLGRLYVPYKHGYSTATEKCSSLFRVRREDA